MVKILLVDDDTDLLFLYQMMVERIGHEVIGTAKDGEEAVQIYKSLKQKPEVIIMDHRMPRKNGIEATKEILKMGNYTKIIFASADKSIEEDALSIGAISFKQKPFSIERLKNNIIKAINIYS